MLSICPTVYLSVCLFVSINLSVRLSLPVLTPICLSVCLSVCLYVCLFSIFQSSAANLPTLYLSVHPFSICLSVSLFSIVPFACLTTYLHACLSVCLSVCLAFTLQDTLKNGFVSILALLSPYGSLLEKQQNKLKIPKIIVPVS